MARARFRFLREFLIQPSRVGAIAPSSTRLAEMMVRGFELGSMQLVVELGPGTGALTSTLLTRRGPRTQLLAVERNERFVEHLRRRYPDLAVVHGSAEDLPAILSEEELPPADAIISGLPWASFDLDLQGRLLGAVTESLRPGGLFATFAYSAAAWLPNARRFRRLLREHFSSVAVTPVVWRNLPPAFAYQCALRVPEPLL